jgi:Asp-tRNA(Asn)/Glu-tRNA(Gln) amidotransferase A subunit family amidase
MAALALGQVDEPDVTSAFRALTLRLLETDPEVNAAIQDALRTLAQRHAELPAQALEKLPAERHRPRAVMAQLLVELERVGATSADATLTRYLAEELASNVPKRMEAARALQAERAARGSSPPP